MVPKTTTLVTKGYDNFLADLKDHIRRAQLRAALSVNRELVLLYWSIGRDILARQKERGWGAKVVDRLAADLRAEYALRDLRKPMGVSECRLTGALPNQLRGSLPTIEELQAELESSEPSQEGSLRLTRSKRSEKASKTTQQVLVPCDTEMRFRTEKKDLVNRRLHGR